MNSFMAALGGATIGGADKYQEMQDEQRKFKITQGQRDAEYDRKVNFENLKYSRQDSGMVNMNTGAPLSRKESSALSPEEQQAGWKAEADYTVEKTEDARVASETKRIEVRDEKRQYTEGLAEAKEKTRLAKKATDTLAKTKSDREQLVKEFRNKVASALRNVEAPAEKTEGILSVFYNVYGNDATIKAQTQVKKARFIDEQAQTIAEMQNSGSGKAEVISMMKEEGMKPKDIAESIEYAMYKDWFVGAIGPDRVFGYKGKGW